jgi:hypothetical protein
MSITYQMFQKASFYLEKYDRETFLADAGQRSRAIIPGDDPGDRQMPSDRDPEKSEDGLSEDGHHNTKLRGAPITVVA